MMTRVQTNTPKLVFLSVVILAVTSIWVSCIMSCGVNAAKVNKFLMLHNNARAGMGLAPLTWNTTLARYAKSYAIRQASEQNKCALVHSDGPYGENLWWGSWPNAKAASAFNWWWAEKQYYDYDTNTCATGKMCGHYTQIVWADTKQVGCTSVNCTNGGGTFSICNYYPPGNYIGQKPY